MRNFKNSQLYIHLQQLKGITDIVEIGDSSERLSAHGSTIQEDFLSVFAQRFASDVMRHRFVRDFSNAVKRKESRYFQFYEQCPSLPKVAIEYTSAGFQARGIWLVPGVRSYLVGLIVRAEPPLSIEDRVYILETLFFPVDHVLMRIGGEKAIWIFQPHDEDRILVGREDVNDTLLNQFNSK